MTYSLPKIDKRSQEDLANELRHLLIYYCPELVGFHNHEELTSELKHLLIYNYPELASSQDLISENNIADFINKLRKINKLDELMAEIKTDKQLDALINIFSVMTGHVLNSLNEAPDKNFTAFLNLIGVSPTAPKVAKAPVVFKLKKDWSKDGFIPAGTKISAQPENQAEVVFETESDLTVIRPGLVRAASIKPNIDCWTNQDFLFSEEPTGKEAILFKGSDPISHRIYIGHDILFSYKDTGINLDMTLKDIADPTLKINWYYFDEKGNSIPLTVKNTKDRGKSILENKGIAFEKVTGISPKTISGYDKSFNLLESTKYWIYGELKTPLIDEKLMPEIEDIKLSINVSSGDLSPEIALFNLSPLDISKDFYPFGTRPAFNDTFFITCGEAFSKQGSKIKMKFILSGTDSCPSPNTKNIKLSWEYWDGSKWMELGTLSRAEVDTDKKDEKGNIIKIVKSTFSGSFTSDGTEVLTNSGDIEFDCPNIKKCEINGQENYWLRVRVIGGNYGEDSKVIYKTEPVIINDKSVLLSKVEYVDATYAAPSIKSLNITFSYDSKKEAPQMILTENNFIFRDRTPSNGLPNKTYKLFSACEDTEPAFYLAFDQDISNLPISLFFPLTGNQVGNDPVVAWEYWDGKKWLTLSVNDAVRDFTRREIQQITIPFDIAKRPLFGTENYWIRARLESEADTKIESYEVYPRISAVYSNAVWVNNSNTIQDEILGSSNGEPSQTFQFSRTPVLEGQIVKVQETLGKSEWTTWEEVQTFSLSSTDSRHYMLDAQTGILTFGTSINGMVPPAGNDNIKCSYKYGGGATGNVSAGTINKIHENFNEIDSAINPLAADGGFDQEETEEAKVRGPHTLKSRDRGVTCEDIEWLVREAAPQIAIVKCFPTMNRDLNFIPERATVIVVPEYKDPKPAPSQELLNEIDEYLSSKISTTLKSAEIPRIDVIGPDYICVGIEATVNYTTPEIGKIIEGRIIDNLRTFLDPLKGGQDKTGWKLGKNLYLSEVCSVIKNTPGVDYIENIKINSSVQCYTLAFELVYKPSVNYPKYSSVKSSDNRILFGLAEKLKVNKGVKSILVKGFEEGDDIILNYKNTKSQKLIVVSVDGDTLECETFDGKPLTQDYPVGTDIQDYVDANNQGTGNRDLIKRSYIMNEITGNPTSFFIKIAIPEARDVFYLGRNDEYTNTTPLKIREVRSGDIFLEEDELVYSGVHLINKKANLKFPYLQNLDTGLIHDLSNIKDGCKIKEIVKEDRKYLQKVTPLDEKQKCDNCFKKD